jgi:hypothetical protein
MPKFWIFLTRGWLGLDSQLSWAWWRALSKSPWSLCAELRTHVLAYDAHPFVQQQPEAARQHMDALIAPAHLLKVSVDLTRQGLLLKRDAARIEEAILQRLDAQGAWVNHERKGGDDGGATPPRGGPDGPGRG